MRRFLFEPLVYVKKHPFWVLTFLLSLLLLTVMTEVGGIIVCFLLPTAVIAGRKISNRTAARIAVTTFVVGGYLLAIFSIVPLAANMAGRKSLPVLASESFPARPAVALTVLLCRNYVDQQIYEAVRKAARTFHKRYPDETMMYLDAGFPFCRQVPVFPHWSHADGRKVDLAFFYRDAQIGKPKRGAPSPVGYWAYEAPREGESAPCRGVASRWRWNFAWLQPAFRADEVEPERTRFLIELFDRAPQTKRILLERHLIERWRLGDKVKFQGCRPARHDDHFHVGFY